MKGKAYKTVMRSPMLHSLETVAPRKSVEAELDVVEQKMKVTLMDKIGIVSILAPRQGPGGRPKGRFML